MEVKSKLKNVNPLVVWNFLCTFASEIRNKKFNQLKVIRIMSYEFAKKEIGDYRITIYQDNDAECPCTEWDLVGVYFWDYSEGYNRCLSRGCSHEVDAKNAEDALKDIVCKYVSQKKIIDYINSENVDSFRMRYDKSDHMWYLESLYEGEWYNHEEFCPSDLKRFDYREELCDILEEDDFTCLLHDCKDIAFYDWSSTGYNQGDYVSGYAYCDKKRFSKYCDTNTKNWRKRALDLFEDEVKCIGLWMWGDVKGYVLEKKRPYNDGDTSDSYDWEEIDSCWGEYYEDADDLIEEVIKEHGLQPKDAA